jgi:serine protease
VDNDSDANDPGDKSINGQRSSFHGTHVAGTIAASAVNGIGGVGVAPNVKIMPVRVLGQDGGTTSEILMGVCFAAQLTSSSNGLCRNTNSATSAADIINLSLGGLGSSEIERELYKAVTDSGIIIIAAAGNESTSAPFYPAAYDNVISVAAVNRNLEQASYSNFGSTIDVAAPGGDFSVDSGILSTWGDDLSGAVVLTYGSLQGTSMASPHVAGVAALMKSAKTDLNHTEFLGLLNAGSLSQDLGTVGRDDIFGVGMIDAQKAVLQVKQNLGPQILSSKNHIYFNVSHISIDFILTAIGVASDADLGDIGVQINGASNNNGGDWLQLNKSSGLGSYSATVDRSDLFEGSYQAELVISSSLSSVADIIITVQLQVGNPELFANAGVQYVVVIDEDAEPSEEGVLPSAGGSAALIANQGRYSYQVLGLKKGNYTVSTGSDIDLDFIICDAGESCGQYPTLDQPKTITISEQQPEVEINMSVNYVNTGIGSLMTGGQGESQDSMPFSVYRGAQPFVLKTLNKQ